MTIQGQINLKDSLELQADSPKTLDFIEFKNLTNTTFIRLHKFKYPSVEFSNIHNTQQIGYVLANERSFTITINPELVTVEPDILGSISIFYFFGDGVLYFADKINDLCAIIPAKYTLSVNKTHLQNLNLLPSLKGETLVSEIRLLLENQVLIITQSGIQIIYKNPNMQELYDIESIEEAIQTVAHEFDKFFYRIMPESVTNKLNFGTTLSGGSDSAIISYLVAQHIQQKLNTFTLVLPDSQQEGQLKRVNDLNNLIKASANYIKMEESLINYTDTNPYSDTYHNSFDKMAKMCKEQNINILFTGVGGNECLDSINGNAYFSQEYTEVLTDAGNNLQLPLIPPSIRTSYFTGNSTFFEHGVWPITPFAYHEYAYQLVCINPELKKNKNLYLKFKQKYDFPHSCMNTNKDTFKHYLNRVYNAQQQEIETVIELELAKLGKDVKFGLNIMKSWEKLQLFKYLVFLKECIWKRSNK